MTRRSVRVQARPGETVQIEREHAAPLIRTALASGGTCTVELGNRRRTLVHDPRVDASHRRLPWPFSLFQRHAVRYVVYEDVRRISSHIFMRNRMDEAIDYFLRDVKPEVKVSITQAQVRSNAV